jgi:5-methylcytosine-specific restriction endonuclease McrA
MRTLVLNADFIPLNLVPLSTISWQEAMCLVVTKKATAICYHDKVVRTVDDEWKVPSILVLKEYKYFKKHAKYTKKNIKVRDNFHCQYCGKMFSERSLTIDHVLPRAKGGKTSWENTVAACKPCNQKKKDDTRMKPKNFPYRPTYYQLAKKLIIKQAVLHEEWKPYMKMG